MNTLYAGPGLSLCCFPLYKGKNECVEEVRLVVPDEFVVDLERLERNWREHAEAIVDAAYKEGEAEGIESADGYAEGFTKGQEAGYAQGFKEGQKAPRRPRGAKAPALRVVK